MQERLGMTEGELTMLAAELYEIALKIKDIREKYDLSAISLSANCYSVTSTIHEAVKKNDVDTTLTDITYRDNSITIDEPKYFDSECNLIKKGEE